MLKSYSIALVSAMVIGGSGAHALSVSPTEDATTLSNAILGSGVTINSATYFHNGNDVSAGTFTGGSSAGIGIDTGIIITSGEAALAEGPNTSDSSSGDGNVGSLTIEFTTETGELFFNYVWASEEYNEYVDTAYNDTFEFLLSGPGITGTQNIALIPGTTDPVTIDNVNLGDNASLFNSNDPSDGTPTPFNIEYDGFTDVFLASALGLTIGETYTLQMIVSDVGDSVLDSAVFIQGGSFGGEKPPSAAVPIPASLPLLLAGIGALGIMRRRKKVA